MGEGGTVDSFGAIVQCSRATVYNWFERHEDFLDAKKRGEAKLHLFLENAGKMLMLGQLRRLKVEEPMIGHDGKPIMDPATGQVLMRKEYEQVQGNVTAWVFACKNQIGYRDKREISGDPNAPIHVKHSELSPQEKLKEIIEVQKVLKELAEGDGDPAAIEVSD